ncbi:MAG: barstar family protein [Mycobacteriaceae bacterium]|nr:barstar family protein [Mycobacteriaceae bacterium]
MSALRARLQDTGYVVRDVRAAKMTTVAGVFDEFAAALQFPFYFGENKDAFDECLADLDDFVGLAFGYVVMVRDAELLLAAEPQQRVWFFDAMDCAARVWAARPTPIAFRVVLQGVPARIRQGFSGEDLPTLRLPS